MVVGRVTMDGPAHQGHQSELDPDPIAHQNQHNTGVGLKPTLLPVAKVHLWLRITAKNHRCCYLEEKSDRLGHNVFP